MKITNKLNLPKAFVDAVSNDYKHTERRYSATTVIKGTKEILLSRRHENEIEQDVSDMIWLIFGTAIHKVLEESEEEKDELKETLFDIRMPNDYYLSGKQDLYSESKKRITDYKSGTVWKVIFGDWEDYRTQCLIYAYMFNKIGLPCDNADIVMMLKDWSKTKAATDSSYPQHPVHVEHFDFTEQDFKKIAKDLEAKFKEIEKYENVEDDLIPECNSKQRWASESKWALMKEGRKSAIKLYDNENDAYTAMESNIDTYVEERKGIDKKCTEYCTCKEFCSYWREHYGKVNTPEQ